MSGPCWTLVSGKGGVGKSTLAAALGAHLALAGRRVALVDLNTGMRGLDMLLGLESRVVFDLGDVQEGLCEAEQALVTDRETGMRLLAAPQMRDSEALDEDALRAMCQTMCESFDFVFLDAASGIGRGFTAAARAAQQALVVTTPDDMALRDAERAAGLLRRLDMPAPALVINRIRPDFVDEGWQYTPEACAQTLDLRVAGVIPDDTAVWRMTLQKRPALGAFPAGRAMAALARWLENADEPIPPWRDERPPARGPFWNRTKRRRT